MNLFILNLYLLCLNLLKYVQMCTQITEYNYSEKCILLYTPQMMIDLTSRIIVEEEKNYLKTMMLYI